MKLFVPEEQSTPPPPDDHTAAVYHTPAPVERPPVKRKSHSRCRCGCGKAAYWPHGSPLFHTRLCGYQMAVGIVRELEAASI